MTIDQLSNAVLIHWIIICGSVVSLLNSLAEDKDTDRDSA